MTQVSKYPISQAVYDRIFEFFFQSIIGLKSHREVNDFFEDFLSETERMMLAKRLAIAVLLTKGYSFVEIRKILRVSQTTIANANVFLKYSNRGYKKVVQKILAAEKRDEFWQKLDDLLSETIPPKGRNWYYWRKEREERKRANRKPF